MSPIAPDLKPASKCPTPKKLQSRDLPDVSDDVGPLDFDTAGSLVTFLDEGGNLLNLQEARNTHFSGYTDAQLYELNQQLLNDSVPVKPLIDEIVPLSSLRSEYEQGSPFFLKQIDWLQNHGFSHIRRTRGDGDCFYRSLAFTYLEQILLSSNREFAAARTVSIVDSSRHLLEKAGVERLVFEDFLDEFNSLVENIVRPNSEGLLLTQERLLKAFQTAEVSNAVVMYLRLLTSAYIRLNRDSYEGFLVNPDTKEFMDLESFCANIVQAMGKEADNVEMDALCRALQVNVDVAYLNGGREDSVDLIQFRNIPSEEQSPLVLLYRYVILRTKKLY